MLNLPAGPRMPVSFIGWSPDGKGFLVVVRDSSVVSSNISFGNVYLASSGTGSSLSQRNMYGEYAGVLDPGVCTAKYVEIFKSKR